LDTYAPFRSRDFRFLLFASAASNFGLQMLNVAVAWDLYRATRSPLVLGNVGFVQVAPFLLFALFAGDFADRHNRRAILAATQALIAAAALALLLAPPSVALIYLCLFSVATARSFQGPARLALLPNVVPPESLRHAITWNSSAHEISNVSGPALAGILIAAFGTQAVYLAQLAFALAALTSFCLIHPHPGVQPAVGVPRGSMLEGIRFVRTNKLVFSALSLDLLAVLFGGATALLPIFAADILQVGASGLGWLRAAPSAGAVTMALLLAHFIVIRRAGAALLWAVAGFGVATILFGLSRCFPLSLAMLFLVGALDNISVVLRQSLVQLETPDWVRGRVLAVNNIFISCSNQLGAVESGWAAALLGAAGSVVFGGAMTILIVGLFAWRAVPLRRWRFE
jgi:MFS family permease